MRFSDSKDFSPASSSTTSSSALSNLRLVCSLIFIEYQQIQKFPVPHHEEQGFLSFNYSSVPRKFLATRAARTPPTIGARMKIQTC